MITSDSNVFNTWALGRVEGRIGSAELDCALDVGGGRFWVLAPGGWPGVVVIVNQEHYRLTGSVMPLGTWHVWEATPADPPARRFKTGELYACGRQPGWLRLAQTVLGGRKA